MGLAKGWLGPQSIADGPGMLTRTETATIIRNMLIPTSTTAVGRFHEDGECRSNGGQFRRAVNSQNELKIAKGTATGTIGAVNILSSSIS
ncbi:MAG TPA: hypothetical protein VFB76_04960 [Candidatus Angelobacter sp.]|nr:hypothetical protein [Candidatus Angelobacter sp.]